MINHIKSEKGITLVSLTITVVILVILAGVSLSLLDEDQSSQQQLQEQGNVLNEFYNTSNNIQSSIENELSSDYNQILADTQVEDDINLPNTISTEDWDGFVNKPKLLSGMTAIYFEDGTEKTLTDSSSSADWDKWYDYANKNWANAKTEDGSYWVWIPRYAYKITNEINNVASSNISVIFVDNKNRNSSKTYSVEYPELIDGKMSDYVVHPAFCTNLENGGTNQNISGFWIAKYEMSMESSSNGGTTWAFQAGVDTLTKNAGNTSSIRAVSKPNVSSWRNITISNAYTNSYYYNTDAKSHMLKNSEWGAVAYLTQSAYGRDGVEVTKNDSSTYVTGTGGVLASSTGNESGVYDLNGGAFEYISAYILNTEGQAYRNEYGSSFATATKSTEYVTIYPHNSTSDTGDNNWNEYNNYRTTRFGDAILETSTSGTGSNAWNSDDCVYPYLGLSFFVRGGINTYTDDASGIFMFGRANGAATDGYTFRVVLM